MAKKKLWIDRTALEQEIDKFFTGYKKQISQFGSTVNQTFEAFVFASLVHYYQSNGWSVTLENPASGTQIVKLKFSTRGRPSQYTYALCSNGEQTIQIRHGLRVATHFHKADFTHPANIVLDVAVIKNVDLIGYKSDDFLSNTELVTFGEAKHMSAFAELIANFIGLAHEVMPHVLANIRNGANLDPNPSWSNREHPAPFLYVSGYLYPTAQGLLESIRDRGYDLDIYDYQTGKLFGVVLPITTAP
jgi:hypothetical protein